MQTDLDPRTLLLARAILAAGGLAGFLAAHAGQESDVPPVPTAAQAAMSYGDAVLDMLLANPIEESDSGY